MLSTFALKPVYHRLTLLRRLSLSSVQLVEPGTENEYEIDDSDDDDSHLQPWKALLTTSGRCRWRVSQVPDHLNTTVAEILGEANRTRKQLRPVHETMLAQHIEFAKARERQRNRLKSGGTESKADVQVLPYGPSEALADLYFRFIPHYLVTKRILQEAASLIGKERFQPKRIIDVGIGTAAASVAALEVFNGDIDWVHGVDPSTPMKQAAKLVLSKQTPPPRVTLSSHLSVTSETSAFDIALMSYTASEFTNNAATISAAAALWGKLAPGGIFVMVEPGTPDGFRSIRTVRSMLLDCANDSETMCDIIAPCTHNGKCPMENIQVNNKVFRKVKQEPKNLEKEGEEENQELKRSGFCSFVHTMPHGDKKEKFSYIVARKKPLEERDDRHEFHGDSVASLLQEALTTKPTEALDHKVLDVRERYLNADEDPVGIELIRSARHEFGRIIHAPMKRRGHILMDVCVGPGELIRSKVSKSLSNDAPGIFAASKKSRWGGFWPHVPELIEK